MADISLECTAWMMHPAPRNSRALNMAWVKRWNMRGHVTQPSGVRVGRGRDAQRHDHEPDLRNGAERQHTLDVALHTGHDGGVKRREGPDISRPMQHFGRIADEEREHPRHEVDARHDHRRGMDQRRHGRRAPPWRRAARCAAGTWRSCPRRRRTSVPAPAGSSPRRPPARASPGVKEKVPA